MRSDTKRNSAFELVRIFAMLFIICHHIVWYGGAMNVEFSNVPVRYGAQVFFLGGALGVDIFFMLSGYFGVDKKFRSRRIVRLDSAMIFYSLLFWAIAAVFLGTKLDTLTKFRSFFPISLFGYWFMSVYVIVYLLSPLFNMIINRLTKPQLTLIAAIMLFLVSIAPAIAFPLGVNNLDHVLLRGIYGYFIGAYIKKYPPKFMDKKRVSGAIFILTLAAMAAVSIYSYKYEDVTIWKNARILIAHNSILMLLCSASLLSLASKINIGEVKAINFISQATMGVYLIHESPAIRSFIWNKIFNIGSFTSRGMGYAPRVLGCAAAVFAMCAALELLRIYTLERALENVWKKCRVFDRVDALMEGIK